MSFVTALALAIGLLVVAPYLAHRLRRLKADERAFAPARLVPPSPPKARKRAQLEDRALLALRALSVVLLALLGASPLVRCSDLALEREGGASVALALVLDDSLSMRADDASGKVRFGSAVAGARQLLASAREGDAISLVLAGAPARVVLAPTTDLGVARAALDDVLVSDRATDLEGALALSESLLSSQPQVDKRVIVLSDLADGRPGGPPLGKGEKFPVWAPVPSLRGARDDCAVLAADRVGSSVRVRVQCSPGATFVARTVEIRAGEKVLASGKGLASGTGEVVVPVAADAPGDLVAVLAGKDAILADDAAPVVTDVGPSALAVAGDPATETTVTGGPPVVEQALAALHTDMVVRPVPQPPDRAEDFAGFAGLVLDDPPGLTPEQRKALSNFLQGGGVVLVALGRRAASAPLGATLEPVLERPLAFSETSVSGADPSTAQALFGESASSLAELGARRRATLAPDEARFEIMLAWKDKAPLVARRAVGRGEAWIVTLPFTVDDSDLVLRPGFLALLDGFVEEARTRAAPRRSEVGAPWLLTGTRTLELRGPDGRPVPFLRDGEGLRVSPGLVGRYELTVDGRKEARVVAPVARELDLRPRASVAATAGEEGKAARTRIDVSWVVALGLLALMAAELVLRLVTKPRAADAAS